MKPDPLELTDDDVLSRVCDLLDRKLFETSVAADVTALAATTHGSARLAALPDSVSVIDGVQGNLSDVVTRVGRPNGIAYGAGSIAFHALPASFAGPAIGTGVHALTWTAGVAM